MRGLEGRAAIVTGGGGGIGRGIARRYAREGASVVVAERDEESGKRTAEELSDLGGSGLFVQPDVKRKPDVLRAVESCVGAVGGDPRTSPKALPLLDLSLPNPMA